MSERIQVSTESLREKEEEWQGICRQMKGGFLAGMGELKGMEQSFWAEPVSEIRQASEQITAQGERIFGGLERHIAKLTEIAAVYERAERENQNVFSQN